MPSFEAFKAFNVFNSRLSEQKRPWAVKFRSSEGFCTFVVWGSIFTDLLVYSIIVPVIPFRLEQLGYEHPSAMTGWLLVAYALGLVCATPPLAFLAERYWSRRLPLIVSILVLAGSQVLYMEAPYYWLMCFARVLQGISSAGVWVVSFSLLCDTVAEERIGRQLGIVMTGLTMGFLLGPPLGGILHETLGYRAPFILSLAMCTLDLLGRLLVIEKHKAQRWLDAADKESTDTEDAAPTDRAGERSQLSILKVIITLCRSKRAFTAFLNTFISGITFTILEPTLPLRLQDVYGFTSLKVGLIYLAAVVPSVISTVLSGRISDSTGVEWITVIGLLGSIPFWILMAIRGPLALLITSLAFANFFFAATVTPVTSDLASAAKELEGIGYAHVFGAFNFAYSCATVFGPLLGGLIYTHVENGWTVIVTLSAGLLLVSAVASAFGLGKVPLMIRLVRRMNGSSSSSRPISPIALEKAMSTQTSSSTEIASQPETKN